MIKEIVSYYRKWYKATAIILVGSRVVGDYDDESDWDFYVLTPLCKKAGRGGSRACADSVKAGKFGVLASERLQPSFMPSSVKFSMDTFGLKLRYSKVVYDSDGSAKKLRATAMRFYDKGPTKWTKKHFERMKEKSRGYTIKFKYLIRDEGHLFLRLCWYYTEFALPCWYGIRQEWPLRPQQSFAYIKSKDPAYYRQLKKLFGDISLNEKVAACNTLHEMLFEVKHSSNRVAGAKTGGFRK